MTYRKKIAIALLVWAAGAAGTARADYTYGCTLPMLPKGPESVMERPWEAQAFGLFLKEGGAVVDYTDKEGRPTRVVPRIEVWSGNGSSRPVSSLKGRAAEIPKPGRFAFGDVINEGVLDDVAQALERIYPGQQFVVTSVETLEHEQRLRWSDRQANAALTFRFPTGEGAPEAREHMLVLFIVGENGLQ